MKPKLVARYPYFDARGRPLYEVCRYEPKTFRRRRPHAGGWAWSLEAGEYLETRRGTWLPRAQVREVAASMPSVQLPAVEVVPYRLLDWAGCPRGTPIVICEGEKDCDTLAVLGINATTITGGANADGYARMAKYLRGRRVVLAPDNDDAGRKRLAMMLAAIIGQVDEFRIVDFSTKPVGFDIYDLVLDYAGDAGWPTTDRETLKTIRGDVLDTFRDAPAYTMKGTMSHAERERHSTTAS